MANRAYRTTHASMPTASIHFTPSLWKHSGITSMNSTSAHWPKVM